MGQLAEEARQLLLTIDEVDPERLADFAKRVRLEAASLPPSEGRALLDLVLELMDAMSESQARIQRKLRGAKQGRSALKAYGGLRSQRTCQRASVVS